MGGGAENKSKWLPIESAPKDGREVDLWVVDPTFKGFRLPDVRWHIGFWRVWLDDLDDWEDVEGYGAVVTHWMPIPGPPEAT